MICEMKKEEYKKMDVESDLHMKISSLQARLFQIFRVKVKIQYITSKAIMFGLPTAEKLIKEELHRDLIISPVEEVDDGKQNLC